MPPAHSPPVLNTTKYDQPPLPELITPPSQRQTANKNAIKGPEARQSPRETDARPAAGEVPSRDGETEARDATGTIEHDEHGNAYQREYHAQDIDHTGPASAHPEFITTERNKGPEGCAGDGKWDGRRGEGGGGYRVAGCAGGFVGAGGEDDFEPTSR